MSRVGAVRRTRTRWMASAAALLLAVGVAGVAGSVADTQAAWTDRTYTSAVATGGTWVAPMTYGCVAMNANGTAMAGGTCTVTSVSIDAEWGTAPSRMRGYRVGFNTNAGSGYVQFTINLNVSGASTNFTWSTAGVNGNGHVTTNNGWTCAKLPTLTGKTPTNWGWGATSSIYFQVAENRASAGLGCT